MSFWTEKSLFKAMIFVPQPPQMTFFSDKHEDSFKHIRGVLTFPIVSIFKGVAPLHCKKKIYSALDTRRMQTLRILLTQGHTPCWIQFTHPDFLMVQNIPVTWLIEKHHIPIADVPEETACEQEQARAGTDTFCNTWHNEELFGKTHLCLWRHPTLDHILIPKCTATP